MKKFKLFSLVLFIFLVFLFSNFVTSVSAQGGVGMSGGQCDSNPACNPTSGTCCNQCDPNPACVAGDPNAIPCCSNDDMNRGPNDRRGHNDHMRNPGCDPNLPHDQPGGCPDGFQGKPHHDGPDDDMNPPGQEGDPYAKQCEEWKQKGSPSWDTHSVEHCSGDNQGGVNTPSQ